MFRAPLISALALAAASSLLASEIATGKMLGPRYDQRAFYVRQPGGRWQKSYTGPEFQPEAAGRLMNLRIAQALFHDEWLSEGTLDPEQNTARVIAALDRYRKHGVLVINASLQCGNPGYNREVPEIHRVNRAKAGPGKGFLCSAFLPDGTMKPAWQRRLLRLARALDERGMSLDLLYFYQSQDEVLKDPHATRDAVKNATDFLIDNNRRYVIIKIANKQDVSGWDHNLYVERDMGELIEIARERFLEKNAPFRLPVSASSGPSMKLFDSTTVHADLTIVHGHNWSPEGKFWRVQTLFTHPLAPGPILLNEDDNGRETSEKNLRKELASCDAVWQAGGSWGDMPWRQTQMYPFRDYDPTGDSQDERYFRSVLEHVKKKVFR